MKKNPVFSTPRFQWAAIQRSVLPVLAVALIHCASQGHFAVKFVWQGGTVPTGLPPTMYMYAQITPKGGTSPVAIAGPEPTSRAASSPSAPFRRERSSSS